MRRRFFGGGPSVEHSLCGTVGLECEQRSRHKRSRVDGEGLGNEQRAGCCVRPRDSGGDERASEERCRSKGYLRVGLGGPSEREHQEVVSTSQTLVKESEVIAVRLLI